MISRWGGFLSKIGLSVGDTVAVVSPNNPIFPVVFVGTIAQGITLAPANHAYTASK